MDTRYPHVVVHARRDPDVEPWRRDDYDDPAGEIPFPALDITLPMARLYRQVLSAPEETRLWSTHLRAARL